MLKLMYFKYDALEIKFFAILSIYPNPHEVHKYNFLKMNIPSKVNKSNVASKYSLFPNFEPFQVPI